MSTDAFAFEGTCSGGAKSYPAFHYAAFYNAEQDTFENPFARTKRALDNVDYTQSVTKRLRGQLPNFLNSRVATGTVNPSLLSFGPQQLQPVEATALPGTPVPVFNAAAMELPAAGMPTAAASSDAVRADVLQLLGRRSVFGWNPYFMQAGLMSTGGVAPASAAPPQAGETLFTEAEQALLGGNVNLQIPHTPMQGFQETMTAASGLLNLPDRFVNTVASQTATAFGADPQTANIVGLGAQTLMDAASVYSGLTAEKQTFATLAGQTSDTAQLVGSVKSLVGAITGTTPAVSDSAVTSRITQPPMGSLTTTSTTTTSSATPRSTSTSTFEAGEPSAVPVSSLFDEVPMPQGSSGAASSILPTGRVAELLVPDGPTRVDGALPLPSRSGLSKEEAGMSSQQRAQKWRRDSDIRRERVQNYVMAQSAQTAPTPPVDAVDRSYMQAQTGMQYMKDVSSSHFVARQLALTGVNDYDVKLLRAADKALSADPAHGPEGSKVAPLIKEAAEVASTYPSFTKAQLSRQPQAPFMLPEKEALTKTRLATNDEVVDARPTGTKLLVGAARLLGAEATRGHPQDPVRSLPDAVARMAARELNLPEEAVAALTQQFLPEQLRKVVAADMQDPQATVRQGNTYGLNDPERNPELSGLLTRRAIKNIEELAATAIEDKIEDPVLRQIAKGVLSTAGGLAASTIERKIGELAGGDGGADGNARTTLRSDTLLPGVVHGALNYLAGGQTSDASTAGSVPMGDSIGPHAGAMVRSVTGSLSATSPRGSAIAGNAAAPSAEAAFIARNNRLAESAAFRSTTDVPESGASSLPITWKQPVGQAAGGASLRTSLTNGVFGSLGGGADATNNIPMAVPNPEREFSPQGAISGSEQVGADAGRVHGGLHATRHGGTAPPMSFGPPPSPSPPHKKKPTPPPPPVPATSLGAKHEPRPPTPSPAGRGKSISPYGSRVAPSQPTPPTFRGRDATTLATPPELHPAGRRPQPPTTTLKTPRESEPAGSAVSPLRRWRSDEEAGLPSYQQSTASTRARMKSDDADADPLEAIARAGARVAGAEMARRGGLDAEAGEMLSNILGAGAAYGLKRFKSR